MPHRDNNDKLIYSHQSALQNKQFNLIRLSRIKNYNVS